MVSCFIQTGEANEHREIELTIQMPTRRKKPLLTRPLVTRHEASHPTRPSFWFQLFSQQQLLFHLRSSFSLTNSCFTLLLLLLLFGEAAGFGVQHSRHGVLVTAYTNLFEARRGSNLFHLRLHFGITERCSVRLSKQNTLQLREWHGNERERGL